MNKGYYTNGAYMGLVNGLYMQFETEEAYREYIKEAE